MCCFRWFWGFAEFVEFWLLGVIPVSVGVLFRLLFCLVLILVLVVVCATGAVYAGLLLGFEVWVSPGLVWEYFGFWVWRVIFCDGVV